jgi:hypothetical protein
MGMTKQTYSINALAVELGMDRRTIAKALDGLRPAEVKKIGQRIEKRWFLDEALKRIQQRQAPASEPDENRLDVVVKRIVGTQLYPDLINGSFYRLLLGYAFKELHLSNEQALDLLSKVCYFVIEGMSQVFEDEEMQFSLGIGFVADLAHATKEGRLATFLESVHFSHEEPARPRLCR